MTRKEIILSAIDNERPKYKLPTILVKDQFNMEEWKARLHSLLKKQIVRVVNGNAEEFENDLEKYIKGIWNEGYNKALSHSDKMHAKIDK